MRKILLISIGGAVGYVLGARAGRPAYDRLMERWTGFASAVGIRDLAATVKEAGVDVRDSAVDRATTAVSTSADGMVDRIETTSPTSGAPTAAHEQPAHEQLLRETSVHEDGTPLDPRVRG